MLLTTGQHEARTRWGTHESGAVFDKKKVSYLTEEAQTFIAEQTVCVIGGHRADHSIGGLLVLGLPGFTQALDDHTCLISLGRTFDNSPLIGNIVQVQREYQAASVSLFFQCHTTRRRLCVHGVAELQTTSSIPQLAEQASRYCLYVRVTQAFFHCAKYIRTQLPGLTLGPVSTPDLSVTAHSLHHLLHDNILSEQLQAYLASRMLCYLCTINRQGVCGINHRGGKAGFLVPVVPCEEHSQGAILLPDYSGNGAFEAIGNILETGKAAFVVPDYTAHMALCFSGIASVQDMEDLPVPLQQQCWGAERVITLSIRHIEGQYGDWSVPLAYECSRAEFYRTAQVNMQAL